jgi:hypothetical protein
VNMMRWWNVIDRVKSKYLEVKLSHCCVIGIIVCLRKIGMHLVQSRLTMRKAFRLT